MSETGEKKGREPEARYDNRYPALPLRDVVVFPRVVLPLYVGRPASLKALEAAVNEGGRVLLISQKSAEVESPGGDDLYGVGCVANILQMLRLPDGTVKVLVEGRERARIKQLLSDAPMRAEIEAIAAPADADDKELRRALVDAFAAFVKSGKKITSEALAAITALESMDRLTDAISAHLSGPIAERQKLLETAKPSERAKLLITRLARELEFVKAERQVRGRVKDQIERSHREYYLNEQMKAIQKELGEDGGAEIEDLKKRLREAGMPEQARRKCAQELKKLGMMSSMSAEASVIRTFVETLLGLPWKKRAKVNRDLKAAQRVLDEDHYGLEKVKERILEYLAIQQRVRGAKAPILCLVGPPGVGKTSLGRSIARATNRVFARVALGGVRDEAEIRGHRRTYVGALPGKVMQCMARAGVKNPLLMLDEIDKLGMDFRGDPSSALLEVLDPEQNHAFADHYIEVDYDLSEVMFITTANTLHIPPALADRLEVIRLAGYTEDEKIRIAERHLLPKQFRENGIGAGEAVFHQSALRDIIRYYTREAGVRNLERSISKVCRKLVLGAVMKQNADADAQNPADKSAAEKPAADKAAEKSAADKGVADKTANEKSTAKKADEGDDSTAAKKGDKAKKTPTLAADAKPLVAAGGRPLAVGARALKKYLGVRQFKFGAAAEEEKIGQVTGLAWTEVGGELLRIEAVKLPGGRGKIIRTGKLGEVMRESVEAAFSVVRARTRALGIAENFQKSCDIHVHLPEGAIPKDGPSAGIGVAAAIASVLTGIPVRPDVAMTGEITLGGEVLPIGGLKEKLLAAHRGGIRRVILPEENRRHLEETPANVRGKFSFHFVRWIDEVFELALARPPRPLPAAKPKRPSPAAAVGAPPPAPPTSH